MATVVGVLLIVLCLVGVPLASDGSGMWGIFPSTPNVFPVGSTAHDVGEAITTYLGVAHGWLYMLFLITAFQLSRRERWDLPFTLVTLVCGTIPILSFWAEHRATAGPGPVGDPHPASSAAQPVTTAFVLGGGGVLGAVEVGMLRALFEREINPI